ncbi:concanavalin A-like lectin/glucanase domain-containing protein [Pseudoneurospora amorphoporcata]|uniref:Concanavalin A-like lectin/glucanase domain-containing protein n=1 Tax=Pseudoneurospora amorphoporcata TaxID=241081 RepID=A0AAN6SCH4_9PEZI|nr:concanavalin A-like lectin/glucanase domain-containing protein [Pseudoneurospora amorphoporcata]
MRLLAGIVALGGVAEAAQYLVNDLSFGFGARINPDGRNTIPNYSMQGNPNVPELLSNKVILTPPAPGNQRGAVWADKPLEYTAWTTDIDFRVNGPERGSGLLNIWLAKDGARNIGSQSIYTVGKFEGLVLVINQHGGSAGMIRGFLNDGTLDYSMRNNVDNLAFGHCWFAYRNLGRPSQIKLRHNSQNFKVEVDGRLCFESSKIYISSGSGYSFGITAASGENPDSFEVFKVVVLSEDDQQQQPGENQKPFGGTTHDENGQKRPYMSFGRSGQAAIPDPYDNAIPDVEANSITSSKAQFADLHTRIQSINHHLSSIFRSVAQYGGQHQEMLVEMKGLLTKLDRFASVENKLENLEREVRSMRSELTARLKESEHSIKYHVTDKHEDLAGHVVKHAAPGHTKLYLAIVLSQTVVAVGYFIYKRRKAGGPKKYL